MLSASYRLDGIRAAPPPRSGLPPGLRSHVAPNPFRTAWDSLVADARDRFDLTADQAAPERIDGVIRDGVAFRGTNLWLLILAILIASVGLNVNSTAVIIGAMLVSPLMGPIMGVGYGAGIADFALVRRAGANLAVAVTVSLLTSAVYFSLTPLSAAHSELLARTSPTIWDVLIAAAGGLAGIIGLTRREPSNVIPGVAIATALMPPLCTAGHGIATGQPAFFFGAFYLFLINSVFIAAATLVITRVLALPFATLADPAAARRSRTWVLTLVILTALPSVWLTTRLVGREIYAARAATFVASAFPAEGPTLVVARDLDPGRRRIHLTVVGAEVSPERRDALAATLPQFGLQGSELVVVQNRAERVDVDALRQDVGADIYRSTLAALEERSRRIEALEARLAEAEAHEALSRALAAELRPQFPSATRVEVTHAHRADGSLLVVALVATPEGLGDEDRERAEGWLKVRAAAAEVWVLTAPEAPSAPPPP